MESEELEVGKRKWFEILQNTFDDGGREGWWGIGLVGLCAQKQEGG